MNFLQKSLFTGCLSILVISLCAQTDSIALSLQSKIKIPESLDFSLDAAGNTYIVTEHNTLEKYDITGKKRSQFSQNQFGNIQSVNTTNPLKVMVWYADFRSVLLLDRSLTQLGGALNLMDKGYPEVRVIAPAADGNLWVMDETAFKLRKLNPEGEQLLESQSLQILMGTRLNIRQMVDNGNNLVAADTSNGLLLFDVFGQFQKRIAVADLATPIAVEDNLVRWISDTGVLYQMNLAFPAAVQRWTLPAAIQQATQRRLFPGGVAIVNDGYLEIWKL